MRIVIPVEDDRGLNSRLSEHFGRAPLFLMIELDERGRVLKQETIRNEGEHFGGRGRPADRILQLKPDAIIVYGMGPRALSIFQQAKVAVLKANSNLVRDLIPSYVRDELEELTEGCRQARHKY